MAKKVWRPGIYEDMTYEQYEEIPGVRVSELNKLAISPRHLQSYLLTRSESTKSLRLGSAVDCAVTEPAVFTAKYVAAPDVDRRTKVGKDQYEAFLAANSDKVVLPADEYTTAVEIAQSVARTETASQFLTSAVHQAVVVWKDPATGRLCKGRIDAYKPELMTAVDLKTTRDYATEFARSLVNYGYSRQAAWYLTGLRAVGADVRHFVFVVVETTAPYGVCTYRLKDEVVDLAAKSNAELLLKYDRCCQTNEFPCYPDAVVDLGLPAWAKQGKLVEGEDINRNQEEMSNGNYN